MTKRKAIPLKVGTARGVSLWTVRWGDGSLGFPPSRFTQGYKSGLLGSMRGASKADVMRLIAEATASGFKGFGKHGVPVKKAVAKAGRNGRGRG